MAATTSNGASETRSASWRQIAGVASFSILGATFIMAIAMGASYMTQALFFLAHHVGWASWAVPATIDVLALMSNLALALPPRPGFTRKGLWSIFVFALAFSMVLNLLAGENFIASTAHGWVVVAYLAAEYVRGWVKSYRAALEDENEDTASTAEAERVAAEQAATFDRALADAVQAEIAKVEADKAEAEKVAAEKAATFEAAVAEAVEARMATLTVAELDDPDFPQAPVSGAPARGRKRTIRERQEAGEDIVPSERTERRYRTGK